MTKLMIMIILTAALSIQTRANQAAYIQATKAEYTFAESIPDPNGHGEIVIRMEQSAAKHFSKIQVVAFGKMHDLSKELLSTLDNYSCSGLTVMHGYDQVMNCQVIYLRLSMAVFEQTTPVAVIVVPENGEPIIRKAKRVKSSTTPKVIPQSKDGAPVTP